MTQTRSPRSRRDPNIRCRGIVYGFNILDPTTREIRVDYVGKTVQRLDARELQHRGADEGTDTVEQPWSDLIVGKPFIIEEGWWTADELAEREIFHIHRLRPRYNYTDNLDNPARIPIPVAREQREARDRARGVPSPVWKSSPPARTQLPRRAPAPVRREWSRRQRRAAGWLSGWAGLAAAFTVAAVVVLQVAVWPATQLGAGTSTVLLAAGWVSSLSRRRRRTLVRLVAVGAVLAAVVWHLAHRSIPVAG